MNTNVFGLVPKIPQGLLHDMYAVSQEKKLDMENGGQWTPGEEVRTKFSGVVLPVGNKDLIRAEAGSTTTYTDKIYTNGFELPILGKVYDPPSGLMYTVSQELGHNSLHPMKRYLVECSGKAGT